MARGDKSRRADKWVARDPDELRRLRDKAKLKNETIANRSGVSLRTVERFFSGKGDLPQVTVEKVARQIGISDFRQHFKKLNAAEAAADFPSREKLVETIAGQVREGNHRILLYGVPGGGKKAAAHRVIERLRHLSEAEYHHPMILSLSDGGKKTAAEEILRSLVWHLNPERKDVPEALRANRKQLQGICRQLLEKESNKVVLILEEASDHDQLEPLLGLPSLLLLITSSSAPHLLRLHDVVACRVDPIEDAEGADYLERTVGSARGTKDEFLEIAKLCGGLPYVLLLVGDWLRTNPNFTVTDYLSHLVEHPLNPHPDAVGREDRLRNVLSVVLPLLQRDEDEAVRGLVERWLGLAVFPQHFSDEGAAAVWQMDGMTAKNTLTRLCNHSLVLFDQPSGRYRLQNLMRNLARERPDFARIQAEIEQRHDAWVDALAAGMNNASRPADKAERVITQEWPNLQAAFDRAAGNREGDEAARRRCVRLSSGKLGEWCHRRLTPGERAARFRLALTAAEQGGVLAEQAAVRNDLGLSLKSAGKLDEAATHYCWIADNADNLGNDFVSAVAQALNNYSEVLRDQGEVDKAASAFSQSEHLFKTLGEGFEYQAAVASAGREFTYFEHQDGRFDVSPLQQHLQLAQDQSNPRGTRIAFGRLVAVYLQEEQGDAFARNLLREFLEFIPEVGIRDANDRWMVSLLTGLVDASAEGKKTRRQAVDHLHRALDAAKHLGISKYLAHTLWELAKAESEFAPAEAAGHANEARKLFAEMGHWLAPRIETRSKVWLKQRPSSPPTPAVNRKRNTPSK